MTRIKMGYFRFFLAFLVAFSHIPDRHLPLNLGVSAVIAFYFISGYLMQMSYGRFCERSTAPISAFYKDRFIRIFPTFWIAFAIGLIVFVVVDKNWYRWETVAEFLLLPYHIVYMFGSTNIVLPAWSLSAELAFYLLLPFLFRISTRYVILLVVVLTIGQFFAFSIVGNFAEVFFNGNVDQCVGDFTKKFCKRPVSDVFGYRWLPFVFVYFALGTLCFRLKEHAGHIVGLFVVLNFVYLLIADGYQLTKNGYVDDEIWGVIIFMPFSLFALKNLGLGIDWLNDLLGRLTYPFFLTHWPARNLVNYWELESYRGVAMIAIGLAFAFAIMLVQKRMDKLRYSTRGFGRASDKD